METITIKELFSLLRELTESTRNRSIFVKTDCVMTTDVISSFAGKMEKIRIRRDDISGKIEPQHRVLLDRNYGFSGKNAHEELLKDVKLYEKESISKVFVVEYDYDGPVPSGFEAYICRDDNAMNVGAVIEKLEAIENKQAFIVCKQNYVIKGFLTPHYNTAPTDGSVCLHCDTTELYPVSAILDTLKRRNSEAVFMIIGNLRCLVYDIESYDDCEQEHGYGTVHLNCMSIEDIIEFYER